MSKRWKGTALVTGGAKRIGKGIALKLATLGYRIALHYQRSLSAAEKTATAIKKQGGQCQLFQCDLEQEDAVAALVPQVRKSYPDLNLLVNNASLFERGRIQDGDIDSLNRHWAINCKAPYILTSRFAKMGRGQIINILDTNVVKNKVTHVPYLLSKKALADVTRLAAVELAPAVRVNAVAPGYILPPEGDAGQRNIKQIPMKRKGSIALVTDAIAYLLTNKFLTGQIIFVDGGEHL